MGNQIYACNCPSPKIVWQEQAPGQIHKFRVVCEKCEKFFKWGSLNELNKLIAIDKKPEIALYKEEQSQKFTVDKFFE